jgi:hypothetical protein
MLLGFDCQQSVVELLQLHKNSLNKALSLISITSGLLCTD